MVLPTQTVVFHLGFGDQINGLIAQLSQAGVDPALVTKTDALFASILKEAAGMHYKEISKVAEMLNSALGKYWKAFTKAFALEVKCAELQSLYNASQAELRQAKETIRELKG